MNDHPDHYQRGVALIRDGEYRQGVAALIRELQRTQPHPRATQALLEAIRAHGDLATGSRLLTELVREQDQAPGLLLALGGLQEELGREQAAITAYILAMVRDLSLRGESYRDALAQLQRLCTTSPSPGRDQRLAAAVDQVERMRKDLGDGRFADAFGRCELILDLGPDAEILEALLQPLDFDSGQRMTLAERFELLSNLSADSGLDAHEPWRQNLRVALLARLWQNEQAFEQTARLADLPRRYAWMHYHRALMLLRIQGAYAASERAFEIVLDAAPYFWKARANQAESLLCRGDSEAAFALMDQTVSRLDTEERGMALGWRGELRLWMGDYAAAERDLTDALELGAPVAECTRGGVRLLLGRVDDALSDLRARLRVCSEDQEAQCWLGEAYRRQGRWEDALPPLDAAIHHGDTLWALVNRALVRAATGDETGLRVDYAAIPGQVRAYFEWKQGLQGGVDSPLVSLTATLESMLTAARGVRRSEHYLFPLWMPAPLWRAPSGVSST